MAPLLCVCGEGHINQVGINGGDAAAIATYNHPACLSDGSGASNERLLRLRRVSVGAARVQTAFLHFFIFFLMCSFYSAF